MMGRTPEKEIRSHLAGCESCQEKFDQTRQLMGLLDLHHRTEAALGRLQERIAQEARPRSTGNRFWPGVRQFASVAALLLLVLGLGLWLPMGPTSSEAPLALRADLSLAPRMLAKADHPSALEMRHPGEKRAFPTEPPSRKKAKALPIPVQVVFRNPSDRTLFLRFEKNFPARSRAAPESCARRSPADLSNRRSPPN